MMRAGFRLLLIETPAKKARKESFLVFLLKKRTPRDGEWTERSRTISLKDSQTISLKDSQAHPT
jgi:hypothetical protein